MRNRESKEKARDLHIIRRASLHYQFPTCYVCGHVNDGLPFELTAPNGEKHFMTTADSQIDYCHLDARSQGGLWSEENLTVGHHYCNLAQREDSIEFFASVYPTALTAQVIRERSKEAKRIGDDMINGSLLYPAVMLIAAKMLRDGKPARLGKEWKVKIENAA